MSAPRIHNRISPERLAIKAGDPVIVHKDDGSKVKTICTAKPWQLGGDGGTWVAMVSGIKGCYALSRIQPDKQ